MQWLIKNLAWCGRAAMAAERSETVCSKIYCHKKFHHLTTLSLAHAMIELHNLTTILTVQGAYEKLWKSDCGKLDSENAGIIKSVATVCNKRKCILNIHV